MHNNNRKWFTDLARRLPQYFKGTRVLELGSLNVNGTVRDYVKKPSHYVGVDLVPGPCVDVVCAASEYAASPESFDMVISTSMIEHDPDWEASLDVAATALRKGGLLILSWGCEGNKEHHCGPGEGYWKPVLIADVLKNVLNKDFHILEAVLEEHIYGPGDSGIFSLAAIKGM